MKEQVYFRTNTLLKNLVGKDLINDDNIAIIELVKNSFDARSKNVLVEFRNVLNGEIFKDSTQIIICDDGVGMSSSDLTDKWLNIAYSDKAYVEQEDGAYLAGNKGIGRFSCDRLGEKLSLITRKTGDEIYLLTVDWTDFEVNDIDKEIQKIPVSIETITKEEAKVISGLTEIPITGTILVISVLRSHDWDTEKLKKLKVALEKFQNPNQLFQVDQPIVTLSIPAINKKDQEKPYSERITGVIENQIFAKLKFNTTFIQSEVSADGTSLKTELFHEGEKVFEVIEKRGQHKNLARTKIVIYYLGTYKKAYFKRQTGVRSIDFGSIFLFLDGFRIAPYGDKDNDWLGLDVRKSQRYNSYLGTRDIIGRIELYSNGEKFVPTSSREGLKETPEFKQIKENLFLEILRKLEKFVVDGLGWDSIPQDIQKKIKGNEGLDWNSTTEIYAEDWKDKNERIVPLLQSLIGVNPETTISLWINNSLLDDVVETKQEEINTLLDKIDGLDTNVVDRTLKSSLSQVRKIIEEKDRKIESAQEIAEDYREELEEKKQEVEQLEEQKETYRAQTLFLQHVTSLDVDQLLGYHHEINQMSDTINKFLKKAISKAKNQPDGRELIRILGDVSLENKKIGSISNYAIKANFRSNIHAEKTDIPAFIEQYLKNIGPSISTINFLIRNDVDSLFEINAVRLELSILLDNLISNSRKAGASEFLTHIELVSPNKLRLSFQDNGKGVSNKLPNLESMFEMGITTTNGSGLGLYQAKQIVKKLGGTIEAVPIKQGLEIRVEMENATRI